MLKPRSWAGRIPGRVVEVRRGEGAVVLTGDGEILLREVQPTSGQVNGADQVLRSVTDTLE